MSDHRERLAVEIGRRLLDAMREVAREVMATRVELHPPVRLEALEQRVAALELAMRHVGPVIPLTGKCPVAGCELDVQHEEPHGTLVDALSWRAQKYEAPVAGGQTVGSGPVESREPRKSALTEPAPAPQETVLVCPFCAWRWPTTMGPAEWESCPGCHGSFSFQKPSPLPAHAPEPSEEAILLLDCLEEIDPDNSPWQGLRTHMDDLRYCQRVIDVLQPRLEREAGERMVQTLRDVLHQNVRGILLSTGVPVRERQYAIQTLVDVGAAFGILDVDEVGGAERFLKERAP